MPPDPTRRAPLRASKNFWGQPATLPDKMLGQRLMVFKLKEATVKWVKEFKNKQILLGPFLNSLPPNGIIFDWQGNKGQSTDISKKINEWIWEYTKWLRNDFSLFVLS